MVKIAILGYGMLGKAVHRLAVEDEDVELVGIFSRRKLDVCGSFDAKDIDQFVGKIDVVVLCTSSMDETMPTAARLAGKFCTVDTFDVHSQIAHYKQQLDGPSREGGTTSIVSIGWDPGILSMARAICGITRGQSATFWGKGISQGHTSAIKRVAGVEDGIQLTIPSKRAVARAACGRFATDTRAVCKRLCYVVAPNKKGVKEQIGGIKEYFEGYKTIVRLVSGKRLARIKRRNLGHKGRIVFVGDNARMQFCLATHNNALLTAEIALAYAKIVPLLNKNGFVGALDCFDIPLKYLCKGGEL